MENLFLTIEEEVVHHVPEHVVVLSFVDDYGAIAFEAWLSKIGGHGLIERMVADLEAAGHWEGSQEMKYLRSLLDSEENKK
jgi:hypothetical protein